MHFEIKGTKKAGFDHAGSAAIKLLTTKKDYELVGPMWTQTDANMTKGLGAVAAMPTDVVCYVTRLDADARARMHESPAEFAETPDERVFTRANSLHPNSLRILAGVSPRDLPWESKGDEDILLTSTSTKADIVALPLVRKEKPDALFERLNAAEDMMKGVSSDKRKVIAPMLPMKGRYFRSTIDRILDTPELSVVVLECRGLAGLTANLELLHKRIEATDEPPFFVVVNGPRAASSIDGSGMLILAKYGIQAVAPRVHYGKGGDAEDSETAIGKVKWFHRTDGGYLRRKDLPTSFDHGCGCYDAPAHAIPALLGEILAARRRHETRAHAAEMQLIKKAAVKQTYEEYRAQRPRLDAALTELSSAKAGS